ncbi:MAG: PAS domain S-box protein [Phycisphaerales bacterium]|nr:PAS domain S-box protein [Phycisphaerales bacterium]
MTDDHPTNSSIDPRGDDSLVNKGLAEVVYRCMLDAMIVMDHHGNVVEFNKRATEIFGYEQREALGRELAELIVPDEFREAHRAGLAHFLAHGVGPVLGQRIEIEGIRKDGERVPVELAIAAEEVDGEPVFVATLRDLTQLKAREAELDRVRGYLDDVSNYGPTVFFVVRRREQELVLAWISPNISTILGFDATALETNEYTWDEHLYPDDLPMVVRAREEIWAEGQGQLEYRIIDLSGRIRWIRESQRVITLSNGERELVGSIEDMTDARRSEQRERMLRRELDHRVKNNLQIILGECELAAAGEVIDRDRIVSLTSRVASMAMVHQMLAERAWKPISLKELVEGGGRAMISESDQNPIQCDGPELQVGVDAAMTIGSVINELMTNAAKYGGLSPDGSGVVVNWSIEGEEAEAQLLLSWRESVPQGSVVEPEQKNFGMQLIEGMIPYELEGEVTVEFQDKGFRFDASIPLSNCQYEIGRLRGHASDEGTSS